MVVLCIVVALTVNAVRIDRNRAAAAADNRRAATLVALAVCQQANILVEASLAKKTPEEQRLLRPLITQYLDPLNRALEALGHKPSCDAS